MTIIFFGSTDDSVIVLEKLRLSSIGQLVTLSIACVVTQPPRPVGRKYVLTPTPVATWGKEHGIPVLSFPSDSGKPWLYADENQVIDSLQPFKADLIVSACYGQKIPQKTINDARFGGLNVHPSLLPRWRGADPVPWALLSGDHQTGVTVVTLSDAFDAGLVVAQKKLPIMNTDTSDPLRSKLFTMGAALLLEVLPNYSVKSSSPRTRGSRAQKLDPGSKAGMTQSASGIALPYARRLKREDGFEPWDVMLKAFEDTNEAMRIDRKFRAFAPWPGLWTTIKVRSEEKRLKILACHLDPVSGLLFIDTVQREGKKPVSWEQFQGAYLPS